MASKGIASNEDAIEQVLHVYYRDEYYPELVTVDIGKKFRGVEASFKLWPACGQTFGYIQAILQIIKEHNIKLEDIDQVWLTGSKSGEVLYLPLEAKLQPASSISAKFSLPFVIGVALTKGTVGITHFLSQNLKDPDVLKMAKRIKHFVDPSFNALFPVRAEIKTIQGVSFSCQIESAQDSSRERLGAEGIIAKFKECAGYSKKPLSQEELQKIIDMIFNLERVRYKKDYRYSSLN